MTVGSYPNAAKAFRIGQTDAAILQAVNRLGYLTASQLTRLLYPGCADQNRYSQRRLRRLAEAGYLLRLRELPTPRYGAAPLVFTLAAAGRQYLKTRGIEVEEYYRPSEEIEKARNTPFLEHTLAVVDVLIAAERLAADLPGVALPRLLTERALKRAPCRVVVPALSDSNPDRQRQTTVIPDAWFQLAVGLQAPVSIALEVDRATEDQKRWRAKVAALVCFGLGPYREAFGSDNLTIAVVTPHPARRDVLRAWTARELTARNLAELSEIFLFTDASPLTRTPPEFFFTALWYPPGAGEPVTLLDAPQPAWEEAEREMVPARS